MSAITLSASEQKWSNTAKLYIEYFEPYTVAMGQTLMSTMQLRSSKASLRVIECGSGAGGLSIEISRILSSQMKTRPELKHSLTMVDLSEAMMNLARNRIEGDSSTSGIPIEKLISDCTSLPYPDGSFDRYLCNMTVHYAPDADPFLVESCRVLAPGGIAGFTVWGRERLSPAFTMLPTIKKRMGLIPVDSISIASSASSGTVTRSSFYMGEDDQALKARVLAAGYSQCTVWHAPGVIETMSAESFAETMIQGSYSTREEVCSWPAETQAAFRGKVIEAAHEWLVKGEPLVLDVCYVIAKK